MPTFDQRGQKVTYQYNAKGNINFGAIDNVSDLANILMELHIEVDRATEAGAIDKELALDVGYNLDKAKLEAAGGKPNKKTIEEHLKEAKALLEGIAAATGLVVGIAQAIEIVKKLL